MEFKKLANNLIEDEVLKRFSKKFNLDKKIVEILFNRGVDTEDKIDKFLNENINDLKDPFLLTNMEQALNRIVLAINNNEKILIFGDYDVDGICATSILYNFLITKTQNVTTYLPNRHEDGYGLSCPCIDKIAEREKPNLIITVDCGISCKTEIDYIKNMGIDIIVTDHHELPDELPKCLIVTTKFEQPYNFKGLCGAGVSFKIVQALCYFYKESFEKFLPISAIATISDIVPLTDENRIIVKEGLKRLNLLPMGVKFLLKNIFHKTSDINSTDIAFKLAPLINSAGRLDDANIALNLFKVSDLKIINYSLKKLNELNDKRKQLCKTIYEECVNKLKTSNNNDKVIVLYNPTWEIGLLGIVAARICEDYNKPTILLGKINDEVKGSARTNNNVNIVEMFNFANSCLNKFGGHAKAGGVSLNENNIKEFKNLCEIFINKNYSSEDFNLVKYYDLELDINDVDFNFIDQLSKLEPFGYQNANPIFKINFSVLKVARMKNLPENLVLTVRKDCELISFNDENNLENYHNFSNKEMLVELGLNNFNNKKSIKGLVKAVNFYNANQLLQTKLQANILNQLCYNEDEKKIKKYTSLNQILNHINDKTLFICYDINNSYLKQLPDCNISSFNLNTKLSKKTILFGVNSLINFENYDKIIFLDEILDVNFAYFLKRKFNVEIFIPVKQKQTKNKTREELLDVYYTLVKAINKNFCADDIYSYFENILTNFNMHFNYCTFYTAILIFKELKLIEEQNVNRKLSFKLNKIKTDLEQSLIFKKINK